MSANSNYNKQLNKQAPKQAEKKQSTSISDSDFESLKSSIAQFNATSRNSIMDKIEEKARNLNERGVRESVPMQASLKDSYGGTNGWGNTITYSGSEDKVASFSNYGLDNDTMNYPLWTVLYNDSWVFRRAIDKPAEDEVSSGFVLRGDEDFSKVYSRFNQYRSDLIRLFKWGALYGGSAAMMMFDGFDDEQYSLPLNPSEIKNRTMKLYVTDRWYGISVAGSETVADMNDTDFGKPMYYNVVYANGTRVRVHHSFIIRYEHRDAPLLIKNGMLQGWGYAEGAHILNELSRDDQLKASIQTLVNKSLIEVIKMPGMRGVFMGADQGAQNQLTKRLEMVNWARTYNSLTFLDTEDEYTQNSFSGLTGLADILEKNLWMIAAALEMQGILYGDLKGGLSQNSDAFKRYGVTIKNRCEAFARYPYTKLLKTIFAIEGIEDEPVFDFGNINQDDLNKEKNAAITNFASTLQTMTRNKFISEYRAVLALKTFIDTNNMSITFSDEYIKALQLQETEDLAKMLIGSGKADDKPSGGEDSGSMPADLGGAGGLDDLLGGADLGEEAPIDSQPAEDAPQDAGADLGEDLGGDLDLGSLEGM